MSLLRPLSSVIAATIFVVKSDEEGNAIRISNNNGVIKGDRYSRTLKNDTDGNTVKDHWERKGKTS